MKKFNILTRLLLISPNTLSHTRPLPTTVNM